MPFVYEVAVGLGGDPLQTIDAAFSVRVTSGRQRAVDRFGAARATITIDDPDGDFLPGAGGTWEDETWIRREVCVTAAVAAPTLDTPETDDGAYGTFGWGTSGWGAAGGVWPASLSVLASAPLFRGYVEQAGFVTEPAPTVVLECVDALGLLGTASVVSAGGWPAERSGERIARALDESGTLSLGQFGSSVVPFGTDLAAGEVVVQPEPDEIDEDLLSYLGRVVTSEAGALWADVDNTIMFRGRDTNRQHVPSVTFTADGTAGTVPVDRFVTRRAAELLFTRSTRGSRGFDTPQVADNVDAQNRYGFYVRAERGLVTQLPLYDRSVAEEDVLVRYGEPQLVIEELQVEARTVDDDQALKLLGLRLRDVVTVTVPMPSGAETSDTYQIDGIRHQLHATTHIVALRVSPTSPVYAEADTATATADDPAAVAGP